MRPLNLVATLGLLILLLLSQTSNAQTGIAPERTLDELKQEVLLRAEKQIYPLTGVRKEEAEEAITRLTALDPDVWARAWMPIGDALMTKGRAAQGEEARAAFRRAFTLYSLARFPFARSPQKQLAYGKAIEAFLAFDKLNARPVEVVKIPYEGKEIIAYLRLPQSNKPVPLVFFFGGIDFLKEQAAEEGLSYLPMGFGVLNIDIPGTGQAPIKASPEAEKMFSRVLDWISTRKEIDAKKVIIRGASWGGYWAARMGIVEKDRLLAANSQGGPVDIFFSRDWQMKALGTREYLIDLFGARSALYGASDLESFLAYGPKMSLLNDRLIDRPSTRMLLVNGSKDTQVPIADLVLLQMHGTPKEAVVIPGAGHVGIGGGWNPKRVNEEIIFPWLKRVLADAEASH